MRPVTVLSSRSPTKVTPLADNYWRADSLSAFHSVFLPLSVSFVDTPTPRHPVSVGLSLSTPLSLVCCVCCPVDGVCLYELKCCMLLLLLFVVVVVMSLVSADVLFRRFLFVFVLFSRLFPPLFLPFFFFLRYVKIMLMLMLLLVAIDVGDAMYGVSGGDFIGGGGSSVNLREVKAVTIHDLYLLCRPDCPEVTLCG